MSILRDSNAPYSTAFSVELAGDAVYMTADDPVLGTLLAIVYRANPESKKLSVLLIGSHGTSGYIDMTLDASSRYFGACKSLAPAHAASLVRKALAIATLRTYSTMDRPLQRVLVNSARVALGYETELPLSYYDVTAAGTLGSKFKLISGKFPKDIGRKVLEAGLLMPKYIKTSILDIIYEDSDDTIETNNEIVYQLGDQLEQLFDPLSEYSPELTESLYAPPTDSLATLEDDSLEVREICEELYLLQSNIRSELIQFLQDFLIPLRVKVLSNQVSNMTIGKLNTMFPPTIDEMFRINNIFYEALQESLPFGSFEVVRSCGISIPYFYRVCMRHEAATKNFARTISMASPSLKRDIESYGINRVENVMRSSLHLPKVKLILERLLKTKDWPPHEKPLVFEYFRVALSTIDQFGKENNSGSYNKRTFTPSGKLLVEIASGWPPELAYGWLNRRIVTIFDAVDILEVDAKRKSLHNIVILFTDAVLILEPSQPLQVTSLSGVHLPSTGDMLMHSMLNEAPLDPNLPPLRVLGWAPIFDVTFSSFSPRSLMISTQPSPFRAGLGTQNSKSFLKLYRLLQPDHTADKFVELLAKAKLTTKTQPFHL